MNGETPPMDMDTRSTELGLALWTLKRALARSEHDEHIDFERLRRDAAYRDGIVEQALHSEQAAVREAAAQVQQILRQPAAAPAATRRSSRGLLLIGLLLALLLPLLWWSLPGRDAPSAGERLARISELTVPSAAVAATAPAAVPAAPAPATPAPAPAPTAAPAAPAAEPLPNPAAELVLRLHGSNTIGAELGPALVEAFLVQRGAHDIRRVPGRLDELRIEATLPGATQPIAVEVFSHGSATAFTDLASGSADLGAASRAIKPEEAQRLSALGDMSSGAAEQVLGLDGLAVIVHPSNPITALSREQVAQLFAGEIRDWSQLGGKPGPVTIYARDERSGTWDTFAALVLGKAHKLTASAQRFESSPELADRVAADPGAIGFIGLPYVRSAKALAIAEPGALPMLPTPFTVATEDYPLARRLYLYLPPTSDKLLARELVEFALSDAGQDLVEANGFISQRVRPERVAVLGEVPPEYAELTSRAQRLSVNFRFRPGSETLDGKAQRDLHRVTEFLAQAANRGRQVLLFGFTDNRGDPNFNRRLSEQRAQEVGRELLARGIQPRAIRGFGPANPVADNDSTTGMEKNRRVEIWVL